ncbi:hypothetical protein RchiOBHm_Chr5g0034211 [Rosa chinensis]|uniref:RING-type E3 ubiquitin transferase n=1 Tax=Rosa chinensis TaxID=74649 RepID=A0A2P6QAY1_ROSCH|nr:hypothetical protein RchiOBHm_Chr5g0034211 [Rosa chinensis]
MEKFCPELSGVIPVHEYDLKYSSHCLSAKNCTTSVSSSECLPSVIALRDIECLEDKRRLRVLLQFADMRNIWYHMPCNPSTTLVGEGSWVAEKNQLYVVACPFLDAGADSFNSSHVGDCSTRLSLTFPVIWTIRDTRSTAGHIWSNKTVKVLGYSENITFESFQTYVGRGGFYLKGQKYEYTQIEKVTKLCPREKSTAANDYKTNIYPNPFSYDMRFDLFARKSKTEVKWGSSSPLAVGNRLYEPASYSIGDADSTADKHSSSYNISYYIFINLGRYSEPLQFERVDLSAADQYTAEVDQSNGRVEVEITLALISTTLACVFVALQLLHVKKHPDMLPSISILMLLILTLGYMIPVMYYFEATFVHNTNLRNAFLGSGGRLQMYKVIARVITVITLVAFLLQFHLLRHVWSERFANGTFKELWNVEKKALSVYAIGVLAVMALLVNSSHQQYLILGSSSYGAYAGLVLDGFLFPQILLNVVCKSKEKSLSIWF